MMGDYKITPHPANTRMYDVHFWQPAKGEPLPENTIRTPIGWVEKLNGVPLTKNEAKALVAEHKERNNA